MLFIYTTSFDTTIDLLLHRIGGERCFRFNFDLWRDYVIEVAVDRFRITDPTGRWIDERRTTKLLWRKPFQTKELGREAAIGDQDAYCEAELWYALREIVNLLWTQGKIVLVEPRADSRVGKFVQARLARRYFRVPEFEFRRGRSEARFEGRPTIVKSLTSDSIGDGDLNLIYATRVAESELNPAFPWMVQEYVEADKDVTVAFVRDRLFAFELQRDGFLDRTIDWRELPVDATAGNWRPHELPPECADGVFQFMRDLGLHFGRLDFLVQRDAYWFLEVNPNGQWAWLDAEGNHGLLDKVVHEVSPATPCNPIPTTLGILAQSPPPTNPSRRRKPGERRINTDERG
jgi:hypothetical protein